MASRNYFPQNIGRNLLRVACERTCAKQGRNFLPFRKPLAIHRLVTIVGKSIIFFNCTEIRH